MSPGAETKRVLLVEDDDLVAMLVVVNIPFVFASGFGKGGLPEAWSGWPIAVKPFRQEDLDAVLEAALATRQVS